ncbi:MAG: hypothetical protein HYY22_02330 [Thaumarchaeota archaeon]|nr:hypothetical protein [Nitrososphaerota archaeon]
MPMPRVMDSDMVLTQSHTRAPSHPGLYTPQRVEKKTPQIRHREEAHPITRSHGGMGEKACHAPLHTRNPKPKDTYKKHTTNDKHRLSTKTQTVR